MSSNEATASNQTAGDNPQEEEHGSNKRKADEANVAGDDKGEAAAKK